MMDTDLQKAKALLAQGFTCALCRGDSVHTATARGIRPVLAFLDSGADFGGFCAADKVVGSATAWLYTLLGVRAVYAPVMSRGAKDILEAAGTAAHFDALCDHVINRSGTGLCPMETACAGVTDAQAALAAIRTTLEMLSK